MRTTTTIRVRTHSGTFTKIQKIQKQKTHTFLLFNLPLSDVDVDEADSQEESSLPVKKLDALHKRTGAPLTEIEMNTDEIKIPPADFVMQVAAEGNDENAMEE